MFPIDSSLFDPPFLLSSLVSPELGGVVVCTFRSEIICMHDFSANPGSKGRTRNATCNAGASSRGFCFVTTSKAASKRLTGVGSSSSSSRGTAPGTRSVAKDWLRLSRGCMLASTTSIIVMLLLPSSIWCFVWEMGDHEGVVGMVG